jgi:hypothetical protein
MDELRDRIAKALYKQLFWITTPFEDQPDEVQDAWLSQADIVITELRLTEEHSYGTNYPNLPPTDLKYVRYVTDWQPAHE